MNDVLMYFLKVNIAIALFYLFYRLVFYNDTFWATRRLYLVFSILLSVIYPFISLSGWLEKQEPMQVIMANYVSLNEITVTTARATFLTVENVLLAAYAFVSIVLLIRMGIQLGSILRWKLKGKRQLLQGIPIVAIDENITPFSFFRSIFINPALHNEQETNQILAHEMTHARQRHSLDVLLSEMLTITCWINPAAWLLKREIRHNLEFLADNSVLQSGFDSKNYQYHLLQLSFQDPNVPLVNKFNVSPLKKRITMMNQQKTRKAGILKYSLIVPLALALVLSSNAETLVASAEKALTSTKSTEVVVNSKENNVALVSSESQVSKPVLQKSGNKDIYEKVEKMPEYPGGVNELMNYLTKNIKYTANAKAKGIEGRIIVRFVVNKVGKIEKAEIIRGLDPSCDKEALRVVNAMPQWIPGKLNGKKVSVYYTLPISFKSSIKTTTTIMYDDPKYDKPQKEMIYESLDKMPQFPNGNKELMNYIARNIKYPVEAQKNGVQGKIIVRFIVISNGKVANPVVVRSIENTKRLDEVVVVGYDVKKGTDDKGTEQKQIQPGTDMKLLEKEAIRVINSLPNFIPGEIKGQKVSVFYTLPITFKLE